MFPKIVFKLACGKALIAPWPKPNNVGKAIQHAKNYLLIGHATGVEVVDDKNTVVFRLPEDQSGQLSNLCT